MEVGTFFGSTLTVAAVTSFVTQSFKQAEEANPVLQRIPYVGNWMSWLVDTIVPEDPLAIRIFVAFLCFGLSLLSQYLTQGSLNLEVGTLWHTLAAFIEATGVYALFLKR